MVRFGSLAVTTSSALSCRGVRSIPHGVVRYHHAGLFLEVHFFGQGEIPHYFFVHQLDAPGVKDPAEIGVAWRLHAHGVLRVGQHAVGFTVGVHKDHGAAASQHELVDGIEGRLAELLGMHHHEHVHGFGDFRGRLCPEP